jgi:hypothetical protein
MRYTYRIPSSGHQQYLSHGFTIMKAMVGGGSFRKRKRTIHLRTNQHLSQVSLSKGVLTHTVALSYFTLAVPRGSSKTIQTLFLDGKKLRYTYTIDNAVSEDLTFSKR